MHKWFWRGLQCRSNRLSPDHFQSVTRHIQVARHVSKQDLQNLLDKEEPSDQEKEDLLNYFKFKFELGVC